MSEYNPKSQHINFDGLLNARELGGMPLADGKVFNDGIVIRADSPSFLTTEQATAIRDYGVTQVIDLRSAAEVEHWGNKFIDFPGVKFSNVPLFLGDPDAEDDPTMNMLRTKKLGDFYVLVFEQLIKEICQVLRLIVNNEGITLFHCAHGKDRTGVIAATLYLLAGASRENIIKNYEISYSYMRPILDPLIEKREDCLKHTLRSDAENMVIFLNYIDEKHNGAIEGYLLDNGLTSEELTRLKSKIC